MDNMDIAEIIHVYVPQLHDIVSVDPFDKGFSSQSWRVRSATGDYFVKIASKSLGADKARSMACAVKLASDGGVPVPSVLFAGPLPTMEGRYIIVSEFVEGTTASDSIRFMSREAQARMFCDFGSAVGKLHRVQQSKFSDRIADDARAEKETWSEVVDATLVGAVDRHMKHNSLPADLLNEAQDRLLLDALGVDAAVRPALTHRDIYLDNLLVLNGRMAALVDFDTAKFWDPVFDFVKLGMWVFDRYPGSFEGFIEGYRSEVQGYESLWQRLSVCLALENFVLIPFWKDIGEDRELRRSESLVTGWMNGNFPWWFHSIVSSLDLEDANDL